LANLFIDKGKYIAANPRIARVAPTVDMTRRSFRKLTPRRKKKVEEFMEIFERSVSKCVSYGSITWINALVEHLRDPSIHPVDIQHWLANEQYFERVTSNFQTSDLSNMVLLKRTTIFYFKISSTTGSY